MRDHFDLNLFRREGRAHVLDLIQNGVPVILAIDGDLKYYSVNDFRRRGLCSRLSVRRKACTAKRKRGKGQPSWNKGAIGFEEVHRDVLSAVASALAVGTQRWVWRDPCDIAPRGVGFG